MRSVLTGKDVVKVVQRLGRVWWKMGKKCEGYGSCTMRNEEEEMVGGEVKRSRVVID